jgi:tRNA U34 5-methylaminomethyl-2-thiouridine-forming methyltransferase MnmC
MYVYLRHGLEGVASQVSDTLCVLEVGFGTGLNAMLTWKWARDHQRKVQYITLEPFPLEPQVWAQLNYPTTFDMQSEFRLLHEAPFGQWQKPEPNFSFLKVYSKIQEIDLSPWQLHVVYFDAFAPDKQPDLWNVSVFKKLADAMSAEAHFVTYCAIGQVKRDLRAAGFLVKTLPGPPGKREMILAVRDIPQNAVTDSTH